jgi:hypothetical protein
MSAHYVEAFYIEPGRCVRFIHDSIGHPEHLPLPVALDAGDDGTSSLTAVARGKDRQP